MRGIGNSLYSANTAQMRRTLLAAGGWFFLNRVDRLGIPRRRALGRGDNLFLRLLKFLFGKLPGFVKLTKIAQRKTHVRIVEIIPPVISLPQPDDRVRRPHDRDHQEQARKKNADNIVVIGQKHRRRRHGQTLGLTSSRVNSPSDLPKPFAFAAKFQRI